MCIQVVRMHSVYWIDTWHLKNDFNRSRNLIMTIIALDTNANNRPQQESQEHYNIIQEIANVVVWMFVIIIALLSESILLLNDATTLIFVSGSEQNAVTRMILQNLAEMKGLFAYFVFFFFFNELQIVWDINIFFGTISFGFIASFFYTYINKKRLFVFRRYSIYVTIMWWLE